MSLGDKLLDIPEFYVYLVLLVLLVVPLIKPFGLPIALTETSRKYFNTVESLEPGTYVWVTHDAMSMTELEIGLSSHAVLKHLFQKEGIKIVIGCIVGEGPMFFEQTLKDVGAYEKYLEGYGTKYVYLPFVAGDEAAAAALATNIEKATGGVDYYGTKFEDLPLMQEVNNAEDFEIIFCVDEPGWNSVIWMNQWAVPYNIPMYCNPLAGVSASLWPYIEAGQIQSMLVGSKGAAEYELLMKAPGRAVAGMDAQSLGHIFLLLLVLMANIVYGSKKVSGEK